MNSKDVREVARLLACLALLHGTLWAESARLCWVRGRVVNAVGEQPLKNARVQLKSAEDTRRFYNVTTDPEGQFAFTQVVSGTYRVLVKRNGFVPGVYGPRGGVFSSGGLLTLKSGDEVNDLLFRMVPTAAISGEVMDEDGEPLPGVEVQALVKASRAAASNSPPVTQELVPFQTAITNDLGEFRLHSLPPGEYYVSAVDSGMSEVGDTNLSGGWGDELADAPHPEYPPTYYPGATNPLQASKVGVRATDEVRIEFRLRRGDMYVVSGSVLDAGGQPLQGANVSISPEDLATEFSSPRYGGETDSSGRFQITGVAPGGYSVQASKVEDDKQRIAEHSIGISGADVTGLELVLLPPVKVSGRITFEGSASLASERGMVWLTSIAGSGHNFGGGELKNDNTFVVDNLLPGRYAVSVTALAGDTYLKSAHLGTADVLTSGLKVGHVAPAGTLELVVCPFGAGVEGTVTKTQKPVVGANVRVEIANAGEGRRSANTETQTDQYGHLAFHALPPGEYTLSVSEEEESPAMHTIKVGLNDGQHRTVLVRLDSSE
jgi:protocatechuate 3,4-dioxygenase beta subunit